MLYIGSFLLLILSTVPSHAYLDPATGSIVVQAIIGAIATGAAAMTFYWQRIKTWSRDKLNRRKPK